MEAKDMHRHIPGATPPAPPPPAPQAAPPVLAIPAEPTPLPGPDMPPWPTPIEVTAPQPEAPAIPDSPEAQEIKAELAHLDEIEATLPPYDDEEGDEHDGAEHPEGQPRRKKRRHK